VLTAPAYRGCGLGEPMLHAALAEIEGHWPGADVQIGAQAHLQDYYGRYGFVPSSPTYVEDGIPHIDMLRRADVTTSGRSA
jgi:ElaA protein